MGAAPKMVLVDAEECDLMKPAAAARLLGVSLDRLRALVRRHGLPAYQFTSSTYRFSRTAVLAWRRRSPEAKRIRIAANRSKRQSFVYFAQAESGPIKVGVSKSPNQRIAEIQTGNSERVRLLGVVVGDRKTERAVHAQFASLRLHGEWFRPAEELLEFIKQNGRSM
jgi:excisionase family DNA binding protein